MAVREDDTLFSALLIMVVETADDEASSTRTVKNLLYNVSSANNNRYIRFTSWANEVLMAPNQNVTARIVLQKVMLDQNLFPKLRYFLYYALYARYLEVVRFLHEQVGLDIHETRFANGTRSAIRELAHFAHRKPQRGRVSLSSLEIFDYFFATSRENHRDAGGYSYLHAACVAGELAMVRRYLEQGADVNEKTHRSTPLRIATHLRYVDVARCLLDHGADLEGSTLLHSLARTQMCSCLEYCEPFGQYCNKSRPVEDIVALLIERGANIEARDHKDLTPLGFAASLFDPELVVSLLRHGASLEPLYERTAFRLDIVRAHREKLDEYPLNAQIQTTILQLMANGFELDFSARYKILKCWVDIEHHTRHLEDVRRNLFAPGATDSDLTAATCQYFNSRWVHLKKEVFAAAENSSWLESHRLESWKHEIAALKRIFLDEAKTVSLHRACQMSCKEAHKIMRSKNEHWSQPMMHSFHYTRLLVKRHVANIALRSQLELYVTDLFCSEHCGIGLPYTACRIIAEHMDDEDLFRLVDCTNEIGLHDKIRYR
ncbi:hypothetical protein TKK_0007551 [Trichogramma kaykai]|uniref:Uncharacterized protein n=1 Tax=Trichogramma kaykai TaxID=54128 RepID=A0ABD2WFU0_9HYME